MIPTIHFLDHVYGKGRNGLFKATALELWRYGRNELQLKNQTSKGQPARGHVALPQDPATLREVARVLNKFAEIIENET